MKLQDLIDFIKKANYAYYAGSPIISDREYDKLINQLKKLNPKNNLLDSVGFEEQENKVKLPITMGSLNKIRPDNESLYKLYNNLDLICMPKLDGLSIEIFYKEGKFQSMYSRGNGFYGQDISDRAKYMKFPKEIPYKEDLYLFGEAVISKDNFLKVKGNYKHPRNFIGGTLRPILTEKDFDLVDKNIKENLSLIDFVCWDSTINKENLNEQLDLIKSFGFKVASYKVGDFKKFNKDFQINLINYLMKNYSYIVDGIVIKINNKEKYNLLGKETNGLNPKGGRAIKLEVEDQYQEVGTIKDIEWNISKRGLFIPVVILEENLNFDGAEINRISGCNLKYVKEGNWCKGNKVSVIRSGGVIPRIISSWGDNKDLNIPSKCPYCNNSLIQGDVHLYCNNEDCPGRKKESLIKFFISFDLKDISIDTLSFLYDKGFNTYNKLLNISYNDLIKLEGFQVSKSINVERELNNCLKNITLSKLMSSSQLFMNEKTGLAETKLSWIVEAFGEKTLIKVLNSEKDEKGNYIKLNLEKLKEINGLGEASITIFKDNWKKFKEFYNEIKDKLKLKENIVIDGKLKGMQFAFTQFRSEEAENLIIKNGGEVKGVTKKTNVLFAAGESTKCKMAEKYGITIIPVNECLDYLKNLLK